MSAWSVNDTVAYDSMQERDTFLTYRLVTAARNAPNAEVEQSYRTEMLTWRAAFLAVDGYDRAAVDAHQTKLDARLEELDATES